MEKVTIPIHAGWTPDLSPSDIFKAGGLVTAKNIIPKKRQYQPVLNKSDYNANVLTGTPLGGVCVQNSDAEYYNFMGTTTKLYRFTKSTIADVTRAAGGDYNSTFWNFQEYGEWLIATNFSDNVQVLKGITAANFQALGGSPPKAKFVHFNNGHLIFAHVNEAGIVDPKKLVWSALENVEDYVPSLLTGAGYQTLPDIMGNITGIGGVGKNFVVASESSLTVGYYVGGVDTFQFERNIVRNVGCFYPQSFISIGGAVLFWGKDTVWMYDGGPRDIGKNISSTLMESINIGFSHRITVGHDKENHLVMWAYPTTASTGTPDRIIVYNYEEDRWTYIDITTECLMVGATGGMTIDEVTAIIDTVGILIDSNYWLNKSIQPLLGDTDGKVKQFGGSALTAEIETGETFNNPDMLRIDKLYSPLRGLSGSGSVIVKHRYSETPAQASSAASSVKSDNTVDLRTTNRRLAINLTASGFTAIGNEMEAEIKSMGRR